MIKIEKQISVSKKRLIISFDLEWTKNYRIKNGNRPFCFSFVYLPFDTELSSVEKKLEFGVYSRYVENEKEVNDLLKEADQILEYFFSNFSQIIIVGHQISSDISVILNSFSRKPAANFIKLKNLWKNRKDDSRQTIKVFDSRYDMGEILKEKSRRLVDVCQECQLMVVQPEIKSSMTKMQNDYYLSGDANIREKLSILNIRHSLSAAILYLIHRDNSINIKPINVNRIIYRNLVNRFGYLKGEDFKELL